MKHLTTILILLFLFPVEATFAQNSTPQWEMWFAFEDGNGASDTIWLGCDQLASYDLDSNFEELVTIDPNQFAAHFGTGHQLRKRNILYANPEGFHATVHFSNGVFPMTMTWDRSFLTDAGLPFYDATRDTTMAKVVIPAARFDRESDIAALPECIHSGAPGEGPPAEWTINAHTAYQPHIHEVELQNSLIFYDQSSTTVAQPEHMEVTLFIQSQFASIFNGISELDRLPLKIYPNPFSNFIQLENQDPTPQSITILNSMNQVIYQGLLAGRSQQTLWMNEYPPGMYFLKLEARNLPQVYKMIKGDH